MFPSQQEQERDVPPLVTETWARLEAIDCTNSLKLLAEVRKISIDFNEKQRVIEQNVVESKENMQEKLDSFRKCKKDLFLLKDSVLQLRDEFLSNAQETLQRFQQADPDIVDKFEKISLKMDELQRLKLETEGKSLLQRLGTVAESGNLQSTISAIESAFAHESKCKNFDSSSELFSSQLSVSCEKISSLVRANLHHFLEDDLKFPFEQGGVSNVSREQISTLHKYLQLLKSLSERDLPDEWPIEMAEAFFEPIKNRFYFHFYGDRKTNDKANARWFLTQILSWIRANLSIFEQILNPIKGVSGFTPSVFFHYRMTTLAIDKIKSLLGQEEVIADSMLFSKLIDDCVEFEEERQVLDGLNHGANTLSPFCETAVIVHWIQMENDVSVAFLDEILAEENRWKSRLGDIDDADEYSVCNCADAFVTHVLCIQNRSRLLPDSLSKRRFTDLHLFLFDEFRERLSQVANTAISPWNEPFPQIMNAIWFLCDTLKEWSETNALDENSIGRSEKALENTSSMYKHLWSQLLEKISTSIQDQMLDLADHYRHNKWASVDVFDRTSKELSPSFCPLLQKIRSIFASAGNVLSQVSLRTAFDRFTSVVAEVLLKDVVECTAFVESGAAQMLFDVNEGLVPVLNNIFDRNNVKSMKCDYNKKMSKLLGALRLLALPWPVATLLREEIANSSPEQVEEKLMEMKVTGVKAEDLKRLFNQRRDLNNSSLVAMNIR